MQKDSNLEPARRDPARSSMTIGGSRSPAHFRVLTGFSDPAGAGGWQGRCQALSDGVPVRPGCSGSEVWNWMKERFPWMHQANRHLAQSAEISTKGISGFHMPPLILVGGNESGRSRWAREAAHVLSLPFSSHPATALSNTAKITGGDRGLNGARPGLAAATMAMAGCANPMTLIENLDSSTTDEYQLAAFSELLESDTASRISDAFLLGIIDASHMNWIITTSTVSVVPDIILDRCIVIKTASPKANDLQAVLLLAKEDFMREWSLDSRDIPELSTSQLEQVTNEFNKGGDLNKTCRLIKRLLASQFWEPPILKPQSSEESS